MVSIYTDGKPENKQVMLNHPDGVTFNADGSLIVSDTGNGRLLKYIFKDNVLSTQPLEIKVPEASYPVRTQVNSKGDIYVLDGKQRRIIRLTGSGTFKGYLDPSGVPSPATYVPKNFYIDGNDNIYILDIFSQRVLILNPDGTYRKHIAFPKEYGFFSDLAVDVKGVVFLVDSVNATVFSTANTNTTFIPLTEQLKQYVRFPTSILIDKNGRIYLLDRNGGSIIMLGQNGSFLGRMSGPGWKDGRLNHPSQISLGSNDEVVVADTSNNRVQIFKAIE
jgi:sugar lactone lactonase YvrE